MVINMSDTNGEEDSECCKIDSVSKDESCCNLEALITIDGRGQIILPKDLRDKAGIVASDKLAVVSCESDGKVCCITLIKANEFNDTVKGMLGPMMRGILE